MRIVAYGMIFLGVLVLAGLIFFISVASAYRHSFTSSDVPLLDFLEGMALLSPAWLGAAALIYFGFRWRKA